MDQGRKVVAEATEEGDGWLAMAMAMEEGNDWIGKKEYFGFSAYFATVLPSCVVVMGGRGRTWDRLPRREGASLFLGAT
eukprot:scaffold115205_cov57-Cyclotella_meneghiniana.AAC.2